MQVIPVDEEMALTVQLFSCAFKKERKKERKRRRRNHHSQTVNIHYWVPDSTNSTDRRIEHLVSLKLKWINTHEITVITVYQLGSGRDRA